MHAATSAAGQAIGKQFKSTTSPVFSTCLITAIMTGRTYKAARPASSPDQNTGLLASGQPVQLSPDGPLGDAAWAKHQLSRATQALPNGYCQLPLVKTCPHANSCFSEQSRAS